MSLGALPTIAIPAHFLYNVLVLFSGSTSSPDFTIGIRVARRDLAIGGID
jgi:hypothetical protein